VDDGDEPLALVAASVSTDNEETSGKSFVICFVVLDEKGRTVSLLFCHFVLEPQSVIRI
jgi:hypothetical protein